MPNHTEKSLLPLAGMMVGLLVGLVLGVAAIFYLEINSLLDQVCLVGISLLSFQLFGSTLGSAIGKG
ncbi:MAG: hypothetical protein QF849_17905 [Pseudomonadales bacterium]|nr:hypothetical protein [Gammaproteobacteria bacterium]MDP6027743.1 hypothetical protein [Pseudomonadales bacterium]